MRQSRLEVEAMELVSFSQCWAGKARHGCHTKTGARRRSDGKNGCFGFALFWLCLHLIFDSFFSTRQVQEAEWKLVRVVLLLLLSFSSCGKTHYYSVRSISVRMEKKKQQQQMKGWFQRGRQRAAGRERRKVETLLRGRCQRGVVGDEVERHDFINPSRWI